MASSGNQHCANSIVTLSFSETLPAMDCTSLSVCLSHRLRLPVTHEG